MVITRNRGKQIDALAAVTDLTCQLQQLPLGTITSAERNPLWHALKSVFDQLEAAYAIQITRSKFYNTLNSLVTNSNLATIYLPILKDEIVPILQKFYGIHGQAEQAIIGDLIHALDHHLEDFLQRLNHSTHGFTPASSSPRLGKT